MRCAIVDLSALADGDLSARRAARVRAHIAGCAACRTALADLLVLKRALGELPAPDAPYQWSALAPRLSPSSSRRPLPRFPHWSWVGLGAVVAAMIALVTLRQAHKGQGLTDEVVVAQAEAEFRAADAHYQHAIARLRSVSAHAAVTWSPSRRSEFDEARADLDRATEKCRAVARARPFDAAAEALLFAAYRKQIRFFEDQMMRNGQ
jgi:anti-sigma factor RsiW